MSKYTRIVFTTCAILAIAFALQFTGRLSAGEQDAKAEKAIRALGGGVVRDEKVKGKPIVLVGLLRTKVTDAGLKELAGLKSLQTLGLSETQVTDVGLKELAGLKSLTSLDLTVTQVTDVGLKELAGLKSLQTLGLNETQVTDVGLKELAGLKSLQHLLPPARR